MQHSPSSQVLRTSGYHLHPGRISMRTHVRRQINLTILESELNTGLKRISIQTRLIINSLRGITDNHTVLRKTNRLCKIDCVIELSDTLTCEVRLRTLNKSTDLHILYRIVPDQYFAPPTCYTEPRIPTKTTFTANTKRAPLSSQASFALRRAASSIVPSLGISTVKVPSVSVSK